MTMKRVWQASCDAPGCSAEESAPGSYKREEFGMYLNDQGWAAAPFTATTYCYRPDHFGLMPEAPAPTEADLNRAAEKFSAAMREHELRHTR